MLMYLIICLMLLLALVLKLHKNNDIPGPWHVPLLGTPRLWMTDPSEFMYLLRYYKNIYGDTFLLHILNTPTITMSHPNQIKPLLSSAELLDKGKPYKTLEEWLGKGLLTSTGHQWRTNRKFLTPAFHFNILQSMVLVFLKNDKTLIEKLRKYCDGHPFDLFPVIAPLTLDNITESIMGVSVDAQNNSNSEYVTSINELTRIFALRMQNPILGIDIIFNCLPHKKIYDKALEVVQRTSKDVIKARREALRADNNARSGSDIDIGIKNKYAFLDLLLLSEVNGLKFDDESIREQVDTFMFEGHDTTASGIVFSLYCISKQMHVQDKILDELRDILKGNLARDPSYSEIQQMKYLEMVIKESLRLYPSVPIIERVITKDVDLGGLHVQKNTSIFVNILDLQRHPDLYEDPLDFVPERFDTSKISDKNAYHWIPFSAGPRNCIGQKLAMMEMKVAISSIIKHFKLLPGDEEPHLCAELVLRSKNGVKIKIQKRK